MKKLLASLACCAAIAPAQASVVFSDSFDAYSTSIHTTSVPNWSVTGGYVDVINPFGNGYIDLDGRLLGGSAGVFSHALDLVVGTTYNVSFDLLGTRFGTQNVRVGLGSFSEVIGVKLADGLTHQSFSFTATSASNVLSFFNLNYAGNILRKGPLLDNVTVTAVPEPETWAMLMAGLGMVGFMAKRRRA